MTVVDYRDTNIGKYINGAFRQYVHMIEMAANGALFGKLAQIAQSNARIAAGEAVGGEKNRLCCM